LATVRREGYFRELSSGIEERKQDGRGITSEVDHMTLQLVKDSLNLLDADIAPSVWSQQNQKSTMMREIYMRPPIHHSVDRLL
jgi:hypothetical protein